jgi:lipoprotein-releasing system permease protein
VLKALGATNKEMRRLFLFYSSYLIAAGLLIGDVIGLGLCFIQDKWHLLKLDPAIYYVDAVPIDLNGWHVLLINAGAALVSLLVVMIPTQLVSHIHPAKAIRFD